MESPIKTQVNTIFVHVRDLKRAVKWYSKLLGVSYELEEVTDPVHNIMLNRHTGLTLDAGPANVDKEKNPSPYPLFNFHTDDINASYAFVKSLGVTIDLDIVDFEDFSFFTVKDPDDNMICTGSYNKIALP